ncbi:hypothetical protein INT45_000984, partial [Circinella minor]
MSESLINNKAFKFISSPGSFSGTGVGENPMVWLRQIKRLWVRGNLSDAEVLLIAASHLTGQAELWWVPLEETVVTWDMFEEAFKARFISPEHQETWWSRIEAVKQQSNESVEDVAYKLQELFALVGPVPETYQVRYFTQAINSDIAYRMEESGVTISWKEAINKAVRIENAQKKYLQGGTRNQPFDIKGQERRSNVGGGTGRPGSTVSSLKPEDSVSQTQTLLTQVADSLRALQLQLGSQGSRYQPPNNPPRPPPKCWNCGQDEPGKWQRTAVRGDTVVPKNEPPKADIKMANTSKVVPSNVNLVETAEVYALGKRGLSDTSLVTSRRIAKRTAEPTRLPLLNQPAVPSSSKPNKAPRKRQPPRKLQIDLDQPDVWERLKELDSGLSMAQWLALDKKAYVDVRDGLKYLHGRNNPNNKVQRMEVNAVDIDAITDDEEETERSIEGEETTDGDIETDWDSTWSEGSRDNDDIIQGNHDGYESDDTEYHYPYDLQKMKKSIPLRGPVVINGHVIQAIFDTGASMSMISQSLVNKLDLVSSGDRLTVSTMDDKSRRPCEVIKD